MSPRRFDGWEPQEVHEHEYDEQGRLIRTVVTREAEWDDNSRGRAMRLAEYKQSICPCGCNLPYAVSHDPKTPLIVDSTVCYAQRTLTRVREQELEAHEKDQQWAVGRHHFVYAPDELEVEAKLEEAAKRREEAAE